MRGAAEANISRGTTVTSPVPKRSTSETAVLEECALAHVLRIQQIEKSRHEEYSCLEHQAVKGTQRADLFHQTVRAEREGQSQGNPGQMAISEGQIKYPSRCTSDGNPLPWPQALV